MMMGDDLIVARRARGDDDFIAIITSKTTWRGKTKTHTAEGQQSGDSH